MPCCWSPVVTTPTLYKITPPPPTNQGQSAKTATQVTEKDLGPIPGQYIVVFKDQWGGQINRAIGQQALEFVNARIDEFSVADSVVKSRYEYALRGFTAKLTDEQLEAIKNDERVKYVEQDRRFKAISSASLNSMLVVKEKAPAMLSQTTPWGVSRVQGPLDGRNRKAWILDTGIDLNHGDLNVDQSNSISYVSGEPSPNDLNGHGTHVAGILAAKDNSIDVVGVAAGATVISVKVLDQDGFGSLSEILDGVNYVANNASANDIINMSLSGGVSSAIDDAVENAANSGLRFAIAAGNEADNANYYSPARVENNNVWTVSAFRQGDEFVQTFDWNTPNCNPFQYPNKGSNFGNPPIEFAGPGESILSLWKNNGTLITCGTSMATPHVAGLLLVSQDGTGSDDVVSNDPDGNPDAIVETVLITDISGPVILESGEQGSWQELSQFGESTYSFKWYYRDNASDPWVLGSTSSSFSHTFDNMTNYAKNAGVKWK